MIASVMRPWIPVNSCPELDVAGQTQNRPLSAFPLVKDRFCCVAGQGFEPWKASADGFTVRSHWPLGQPAW